ncbi:MAG: hypothetical protein RL268_300 [Pseudomonadota bacterium]|jgi:hypothetical protein
MAIKYYTTLTPFGTRPILSAEKVAEALGVTKRNLPDTYGRFWAVRK